MKLNAYQMFHLCLDTADRRAWQAFIERYGRRIRRLLAAALKIFGKTMLYELDDLAQDFYCRLLTANPMSFNGRTDHHLWKYFNRIAHNLIIDHHRAATAAKRRCDPVAWWEADVETGDDHHETPEDHLLRREQQNHVIALFDQVTGQDHRAPLKRRALRLTLLDGWSSREVAEEMPGRLSCGQIDAMVHRLRRKLAQQGLRFPRRRGSRRISSRRRAGAHRMTRSCRRIA